MLTDALKATLGRESFRHYDLTRLSGPHGENFFRHVNCISQETVGASNIGR